MARCTRPYGERGAVGVSILIHTLTRIALTLTLIIGFYLPALAPHGGGTIGDPGGGPSETSRSTGGINGGYRTDYVEELCGCSEISKASCDSFTLLPITNGAGHVALSKGPNIHTQFSCKFTIVAPPHRTVQIVINNISIPETKDCKAGILRVYDGIPGHGGSELTRACGNTPADRVVRSKTNQVTLYYYQGADILWDQKAFNVTYTYVHDYIPGSKQACNETSEYLCANKLCINRSLKCDGYDNCGDRSEELMDVHVCGSRYNKSDPIVGMAIGFVVAILLVLGLLGAFGYWVRRKAGPFFTDVQINRQVENPEGDDQRNHENARIPTAEVDLSVPDLTRDLIDRRRTGSRPASEAQTEPNGANISQSDFSSLEIFPDPKDGPPPSYSSLFPDIV